MFISVVLLVSCVITPINFAFSDELESVNWWLEFNIIIDVFFFIEIIINFNTAFIGIYKDIIDNRKKIA